MYYRHQTDRGPIVVTSIGVVTYEGEKVRIDRFTFNLAEYKYEGVPIPDVDLRDAALGAYEQMLGILGRLIKP